MIRRIASILLLTIGGWILVTEMFGASFNVEPGLMDSLIILAIFVPMAGLPLFAGVLLSPGARWRELGLTLLLSAGVAAFSAASVAVVMLDPLFSRYMPPLQEIRFDPIFGIANWVTIVAAGLWLYRAKQ